MASKRSESDEYYIIDLCDQVLSSSAKRGHRFDFLRGDRGKRKIGAKLPVDAYYEVLNLVIEYHERQHSEPVAHFDKPHRNTVSNMHRGEQRKRYDARRRKVLPARGLILVVFSYVQLAHRTNGRLMRDHQYDLGVIKERLDPILAGNSVQRSAKCLRSA